MENLKLKSSELDLFFEALLTLENKEECYQFFEDVCTINELHAISQRLQVAVDLKNEQKYREIEEKTGASTATISRVNKSLYYGAGGYDMVLERLKEKKKL